MVERLSSLQIFQSGITEILNKQAEVTRTQQELATGRRILSPSDDPAGAVSILDLQEDISRIDQFERNTSVAEGQLAIEETTLDSVGNVLQRVRELVVQANNATQSPDTRSAIAVEIRARLDELVALANTRDGNDEYIFAGFQAQSEPFTQVGGAVTYNGDDGQRFLDIAANAQVAVRDSGSRVFLSNAIGNGSFDFVANAANTGTAVIDETGATSTYVRDDYVISFTQALPTDPITYTVTDSTPAVVAAGAYTAGDEITFNGARVVIEGTPQNGDSFEISSGPRQSVFSTLDAIATALEDNTDDPASNALVNNALFSGLNNLDQALGNVSEIRADVGVRLNRIDSQKSINQDFNLQLQDALSDVQDLDYAEAISRLNLQLVALEAAQQAYVRTQGLSLFNFL